MPCVELALLLAAVTGVTTTVEDWRDEAMLVVVMIGRPESVVVLPTSTTVLRAEALGKAVSEVDEGKETPVKLFEVVPELIGVLVPVIMGLRSVAEALPDVSSE